LVIFHFSFAILRSLLKKGWTSRSDQMTNEKWKMSNDH
jgi:hypothetical protein